MPARKRNMSDVISGSIILVLVGFSLLIFTRDILSRARHAEIRAQFDAAPASNETAKPA